MVYVIYKIVDGNILLYAITKSQTARNICLKELKKLGFDVMILHKANGEITSQLFYEGER